MLVLQGHSTDPALKRASEVLDRSGLSYVTKAPPRSGAAPTSAVVRVSWGADSVTNFSREELLQFLWDHGAKFEDS